MVGVEEYRGKKISLNRTPHTGCSGVSAVLLGANSCSSAASSSPAQFSVVFQSCSAANSRPKSDEQLTESEGHGKVNGLLSDALVAVDGPVGERTAHRRLAEGGDHCAM